MFGGGEVVPAALERLTRESYLIGRDRGGAARWHAHPKAGAHPASDVSLRSTSGDTYTLVEERTGAVLETIAEEHAFGYAHEGAVYLHRGEQFQVTELNLATRNAMLQRTNAEYYTTSMASTDMTVLKADREKQEGAATVFVGDVQVERSVYRFARRRHDRNDVLSYGDVDLPPRSFETVGLWWTVPRTMIDRLKREAPTARIVGGPRGEGAPSESEVKRAVEDAFVASALHAAEHACISLLPLFALCDRNDIGGLSTPRHPDTKEATIFIYDGIPGGVGIAERGYDVLRELWQETLTMLNECPCEEGCPSCVQSPKCGNNNEMLDKRGAGLLLEMVLGEDGT